jgi:hypothetical protein
MNETPKTIEAVLLGVYEQHPSDPERQDETFYSLSFALDGPDGRPANASMSSSRSPFQAAMDTEHDKVKSELLKDSMDETEAELLAAQAAQDIHNKYCEATVGHVFKLTNAELVVSLDKMTGMQKQTKSGTPCFNISKASVGGEPIGMSYLRRAQPKLVVTEMPDLATLAA